MNQILDSFYITFYGDNIEGHIKKGGKGFGVYLNGMLYKSFPLLTEAKNFYKKLQESQYNLKYYADLVRIGKFKRRVDG